MRFLLSITLLLIMSTGCSNQDTGKPVSWSELKIETLGLELIDDKDYEILMFMEEGFVAATIGEKNGPIAAPLLYWRVDGEHLLISRKPQADTIIDLHKPRINGNVLLVKKGFLGKASYVIRKASA